MKRITRLDLQRKVNGLNVKHDMDLGDNGCLHYERGIRKGAPAYKVFIKMRGGCVAITPWGTPAEIIEELSRKDWRHLLSICVAGRNDPC